MLPDGILEMLKGMWHSAQMQDIAHEDAVPVSNVLDMLSSLAQVMLLGEPSGGKTITLQRLASSNITTHLLVPSAAFQWLKTIYAYPAQFGSCAVAKCQIRAPDPRWFHPPHDARESADYGSFGGVSHQRVAHRMDAIPYISVQ